MTSDKSYETELRLNALVNGIDTWHNLGAPVAGWTATTARYKFAGVAGLVLVQMILTGPAVPPVDGTVIFVAANGLPAGYRPDATTGNNRMICYINQGAGGENCALIFEADGSIVVHGIGGTGAGTILEGNFLVSTI